MVVVKLCLVKANCPTLHVIKLALPGSNCLVVRNLSLDPFISLSVASGSPPPMLRHRTARVAIGHLRVYVCISRKNTLVKFKSR